MVKLVKKSQETKPEYVPNALRIASLAAGLKAQDIKALHVRELTLMADCFVICTALSEPQFKAIYRAVKDGMKEVGVAPLHSEGELTGGWLLLDYGNIVVHVFREEARSFYDLDGLWGDAPELNLDEVL